MPDQDLLSDAEAARLWQRAAQLQAEAADPGAANGEAMAAPLQSHAVAHVRAAALEAGIGAEFVEAALTEIRLERAVPSRAGSHSLSRRVVPDLPDSVTASRTIAAPREQVLSAMEAVFDGPPYHLTLTDHEAKAPDGEVWIFEIAGSANPFERGFRHVTHEIGIRQLHISLRPAEGADAACQITVHGRVTAHGAALGVAIALMGLVGAMGLGASLAIGVVTGIGPLLAIPGALLGGWLGLKGHRVIIRYAVLQARQAIDGLLGAVAARARGGWTRLAGPE